ncbi:matrixin family metalloprotease [Streptomyces sp. HUAS MG91]|uniref:Matrixin family metalloprotease n=1 Tax=Streptomyces tabacisoli TaxID=3156398 RepID=A0AAU8IK98_9ACTN
MPTELAWSAAVVAAALLALPQPPTTSTAAAAAKCVGGAKDSRGRSAVDGREVRWEDETKFNDAYRHAHKAWSTHGLSQVKFRPDNASSIADLQWQDVNSTRDNFKGVLGQYAPHPGADTLYLNRAYLDRGKRYGDDMYRRMVAAHELGHALGFCHKNPDWYPTLMAKEIDDVPTNAQPTSKDRANYHKLWG